MALGTDGEKQAFMQGVLDTDYIMQTNLGRIMNLIAAVPHADVIDSDKT